MNVRSKILLVGLVMFVATSAHALCIKCDQSTGYECYARTDGTKANCDNPSGAGCITWGACTTTGGGGWYGGDCFFPYCDPFYWVRATPLTNDMELASVSTIVPALLPAPAERRTL